MPRLVIATHNPHKTEEVRAILGPGFEISDLTSLPDCPAPSEDGATFEANAALKALAASRRLSPDLWVLADDSGLEVDALAGEPGVHSARYSGSHNDNAAHRARLLAELARTGARGKDRRARFRCALALARGGRLIETFEGAVEGIIANSEKGSGGFGYDSLFIPDGFCQSFAELDPAVKNSLSHRARALDRFQEFWKTT